MLTLICLRLTIPTHPISSLLFSLINSELDEASGPSSTTTTSTAKASSQPSTSSAASTSSQATAPKAAAATVPSVVPSAPIKYQYYQSAECLNISILAKGLLPTEVIYRHYASFIHLSFLHLLTIYLLIYLLVHIHVRFF
jgi:hypothetical protein